MPLTIESSRFGTLEIAPEAVIEFPSGLIGLEGSRYALLAREQDSVFLWLHSLENPALALPVTRPWHFFADYEVILSDGDVERIGITDPAQADVYVTVRASERIEEFGANLRAPILIVKGRGFQVINEAEHAPLFAPLFDTATEQAA